jgi:hypothetical protein
MGFHLDRNALEGLRDHKRLRNFYRLEMPIVVEHEFRGAQYGHPSTFAFARFECSPADDLSFDADASWPSSVYENEQESLECAIGESIADTLLSGIYQHSGCRVTLVEVRWDDICSSVAAFMNATGFAMQKLLTARWKPIIRNPLVR